MVEVNFEVEEEDVSNYDDVDDEKFRDESSEEELFVVVVVVLVEDNDDVVAVAFVFAEASYDDDVQGEATSVLKIGVLVILDHVGSVDFFAVVGFV